MSAAPKVSAILISYNRARDLKLAIEALVGSGYPNLEIVVFDNASNDGSVEIAGSFPSVRVIESKENVGFARGNNLALDGTTGDYVALVNNDAVVEKNWIADLVRFLEAHPKAAAAGGKSYFWDDENPLGARSNHYYSHIRFDPETGHSAVGRDTPDEVREVATLSGCAVMIRRAAIHDVGAPFLEPEFFMYYEETDFFARAAKKGWRMYYTGSPAVWHRDRASTRDAPYYYHYYLERNRLLFAYRNLSSPNLRRLLAKTVLAAGRDAIWRPRSPFGAGSEALRARRDAYRWILEHQPLLRVHRKGQAGEGKRYEELVSEIHARGSYYGHPRPEVAALVPETVKHVVDVGCGAGGLGRALKAQRPQVEVRGIEVVPEQAERARAHLDAVATQSAEAPVPDDWPRPDCVIFADVLEHLVDPWSVLSAWVARLAPNGYVVASIPNVVHSSVSWGLAFGKWQYQDAGVLDRTHLRFFTRRSIRELFEHAGLDIVRAERILEAPRPLPRALLPLAKGRGGVELGNGGASGYLRDLLTVQFLVVGTKQRAQ